MDRKLAGIMIGSLTAGLLIGLAIGFFASSMLTKGSSQASDPGSALPAKGMKLADFELKDLDGNVVKLSQFAGRPVLLNFWASWCPPCKAEMPLLQSVQEKHSKDLVVIGVDEQELPETAKAFIDENHLTILFLIDQTGDVSGQYHVRALPTTLFLDANGVLRAQHIGQMNEAQLDGYLDKIGVSP